MRYVVDASALVELLFRAGGQEALEDLLGSADSELFVPALCDIEVSAALRRAIRRRLVSVEHAAKVISVYLDLPLARYGHQRLIVRILGLRENFTAYDATYVALAEDLNAALVTADESLARATRSHTSLETVLI